MFLSRVCSMRGRIVEDGFCSRTRCREADIVASLKFGMRFVYRKWSVIIFSSDTQVRVM